MKEDGFNAHMDRKRLGVGLPSLGEALGVAIVLRVAQEAQLSQVVFQVQTNVDLNDTTTESGRGGYRSIDLLV